MNSRRAQLLQWFEDGAIAPEQIFPALAATGVTPDGARWQRFLDQLTLVLGTLALVCAVGFFIAYNWDAMGRWTQFALVQALMVVAVVVYWMLGTEKITARLGLLAAALLLGALLALHGQTYQTGADSWQLFATWALLMLPWTLVSRFAALWLLLLLLLNLATALYFLTFGGLFWTVFNTTDRILWLLLLLNTTAWIAWELAAVRLEWLAYRWAVRLIATASGTAMTMLVLFAIFEPGPLPLLAWLAFAIWLGAVYFIYRRRRLDLFMLAGACLALIICVTSLLAKLMLHGNDLAGIFLLLSLLVVAQAVTAAIWLRRVHSGQSS
jgi:uncharacterized membrane protein